VAAVGRAAEQLTRQDNSDISAVMKWRSSIIAIRVQTLDRLCTLQYNCTPTDQ